jgi:hypothetical protein
VVIPLGAVVYLVVRGIRRKPTRSQ